MRRLSSVDAQFIAMEDGRTHAHVCQLTILEGTTATGSPLTGAAIRDVVADRIHLMPPFRWRLRTVPFALDYPLFVEDRDFDVDAHVWEMGIPAPGGPEQLSELVARLASRPLDRARPLWELYVIQGLADGRVAMLTKVHHALVDGVSGLELLGAMLDPTAEPPVVEPAATAPDPEPAPSDLRLLARGIAALPRQQVRLVRALPSTLRHMDQVPTMRNLPGGGLLSAGADAAYRVITRGRDGEILEQSSVPAPRVSFSGRITAHRRFSYGTIDLGVVKAIKDTRPGTTVNDVVVAVVAAALRRRMTARGDELDQPLVAMVPINVREPGSEFGNHISALMVAIPTDEADPLTRLDRAHEVMASAKTRHRAIPATLIQDANHTVPPALFARVARAISTTTANGWVDPPFNVTISNLPGSRAPLYCAGAEVVSQHPVNLLLDGVGVSITLLSYQDRLDFGITGDRELVPDVWDLAADVEASVAELAAAAGVPARRSRRKGTRP